MAIYVKKIVHKFHHPYIIEGQLGSQILHYAKGFNGAQDAERNSTRLTEIRTQFAHKVQNSFAEVLKYSKCKC